MRACGRRSRTQTSRPDGGRHDRTQRRRRRARAGAARADHERPGRRRRWARAGRQRWVRGATPDLGPARRLPDGRSARDLAPEPHGRCSWRRRGSCRTDRPPSCGGSSSRRATSRSPIAARTNRDGSPARDRPPDQGPAPDLAVERDGLRITDPVRTVIDLGLVMPGGSFSARIGEGICDEGAHDRRRRSASATRWVGRVATAPGIVASDPRRQRCSRSARRRASSRSGFTAARASATASRRSRCSTRSGTTGRFVGRVDAALPELKLAIEVDGFEHHSTPEAFQRDRTRQNDLVALGWTSSGSPGRRRAPPGAGRPARSAQAIRRLAAA